jgi:hypothetical protein
MTNAIGAPKTHGTKGTGRQSLVPAGLILLTLIPMLAGQVRLHELASGAVVTAANARFVESPIPVIVHIVSVTIFSIVGAFQFVPALRRRKGGWHRFAGRILIPAGLLVALSGMWMAAFYSHRAGEGLALTVIRLVVGSAMVASIALGIRAIVQRKFALHGAWMTRAYAIGVAAGTQAIILIPETIIFGDDQEVPRTLAMTAAWVINLAIAELVIHGRVRRSALRRMPR